LPDARTGIRVKMRELRRSLLVVVSVVIVSIVAPAAISVNEPSTPCVQKLSSRYPLRNHALFH
jgi:hypothetical protein